MMGTRPSGYNHTNIQAFALKMFNNQVALREWGTSDQKLGDAKHESKFLALLMEIRT